MLKSNQIICPNLKKNFSFDQHALWRYIDQVYYSKCK